MRLGVLILTGGASSRMGADKASLDWAGRGAVDRLAALAESLAAGVVATVGPTDHGLDRVLEDPSGGGPAAGALAGARRLAQLGCRRALVLPVDAPTIRPDDVASLVRAAAPGAAYAGLRLPLAFDLARLPPDPGCGWAMGRLIAELGLRLIPAPAGAEERLRGANTPEERAALLAELKATEAVGRAAAVSAAKWLDRAARARNPVGTTA